MHWAWIGAACFACYAGVAACAELFDGLDPRLVGSELTGVLEGAELGCRQDASNAALKRCQPLEGALDTLHGAKVNSVEALFVDERLAQVSVYFSERDFAKARPLLVEKLGDGQDWTVTIRGGMNAGFKDQILIWEQDGLTVVLQQFDRKIDRSSLVYGSPRAMAELINRIKATPPGGVRDL